MSNLPVENVYLVKPSIEQVCDVIRPALEANFEEVTVTKASCPDLREAPWNMAYEGLGDEHRCLADVGGVPNLVPSVKRDKVYTLEDVLAADTATATGGNKCFLGAGAGSFSLMGCNCELMPNVNLTTDSILTQTAKVDDDGTASLHPHKSTEFALLMNLLVHSGQPCPAIKVHVKKRTGDENFVTCMRKALEAHYKAENTPVGLGGVFLVAQGQVRSHVMPQFSGEPLTSDDDVNNWLNFYTMSAPLVNLSTFVSHDAGLDLRLEHTHFFSDHNEGGHYHNDVTPDTIEYIGYFVVAERMLRVDRPTITHKVGRD